MKNFIVGIGGTGAKCLEHLLYCCASGLGPEKLWVGMVDQDEANGNISRTKIQLTKYMNLRRSLRDEVKMIYQRTAIFLKLTSHLTRILSGYLLGVQIQH